MVRWEPDAAARLRTAALDLYLDRGFDQTTVADIAQRAGLTARTFFRYFADKREVLFDGATFLHEELVAVVEAAPPADSPLTVLSSVLDRAADLLGQHREWSRRRQRVIDATGELRERELHKMASLAVGIAAAMRRRGVAEPGASLLAEAGMTVLRVGFERWVAGPAEADLGAVMGECLTRLQLLTAG